MSKFSEIDQILAYENNVNYWQDDELSYVGSIVETFQENDWKELGETWPNRSETWKERCAQVLDFGVCEASLRILCQMIDSTNPNTVMNVISSLRSFGPEFDKKKYLHAQALKNAASSLANSEVRQDWKDEYLLELRSLVS